MLSRSEPVERAPGRPRARRPTRARIALAASVMLLAVALGIWADEGQRISGFAGRLPELGTPWIMLAFIAGRSVPPHRGWAAPLAAGAATFLGLGSYALFMHLQYGLDYHNVAGGRLPHWWLLGLGSAALAGGLAMFSFREVATGAWATLAAVPLAEIRLVDQWSIDSPARFAVVVCLAVVSLLVTAWAFAAMRRIPLLFGPLVALAWVLGWTGADVLSSLGVL